MGQVVPLASLSELGERLRSDHRRVVLTNGHFDLLHIGHLRLLQAARALGDILVVAVNDDLSTRERKGPDRPLLPEAERAELLAGLACVDYVTVFAGATAAPVVKLLRPDLYVKGGDYAATAEEATGDRSPLPEAPLVRALGGEVRILPLVPDHSTSALAAKLRAIEP